MNLSYLKYAVEVEKTGSITKAAQNYYMNQPHLSNESINHLNTYCRYRLGDRWEIPVSHYHFWINMANDKDSQELAIYICEPHMAKVTCFSAALSGKTKYRRIRL